MDEFDKINKQIEELERYAITDAEFESVIEVFGLFLKLQTKLSLVILKVKQEIIGLYEAKSK